MYSLSSVYSVLYVGDDDESGDESDDDTTLDGKLCTYTQTARYKTHLLIFYHFINKYEL